MSTFEAGQEYRAPYPFVRTTYDALPDDPEDMPVERPSWRPGVVTDLDCTGSSVSAADALGEVVFTVVAVFKPGKYPPRVFYTRNWINPEGKRFGRNNLRIISTQQFRTLVKGYRHDYELAETKEPS